MSDTQHKVTVRAFDSAYPGSMFDKPDGEYVEREDADSLAAALLDLVSKYKRDAEDLADAFKQEQAENETLRAQRDELLTALQQAVTLLRQHVEQDENAEPCRFDLTDWPPAAQIFSVLAKHTPKGGAA